MVAIPLVNSVSTTVLVRHPRLGINRSSRERFAVHVPIRTRHETKKGVTLFPGNKMDSTRAGEVFVRRFPVSRDFGLECSAHTSYRMKTSIAIYPGSFD